MAMGEGQWDIESHWLPQESAKIWEELWTIVSAKCSWVTGKRAERERNGSTAFQ